MPIEIKMPNLSQTTDEVKLLKWLVKEGDKVKKGDILCEVETDKVNMEVESFANGQIIKLNGDLDQQIKTGTVIAVLGEKGEIADLPPASKDMDSEKETEPIIKVKDKEILEKSLTKIRATKLVQRLADKKNIDLAKVAGTGPRGTITKKDLENYLTQEKTEKSIDKIDIVDKEYWDLTPNQLAVSANLSKSKSSIPHYYLKSEVLADNLLKNRNSAECGDKLSMYSYFIYYSAKVLEEHPRLNGYFKDNKVYKNNQINIGFAVASDDELYVPIIKDANKKKLHEIDQEVKSLAGKSQNKRLEPGDISGGTFTISNLGIYPINEFYGVINYPQAVLLAIGKIQKILNVNEDNSLSIRSIFNITGSFDHRIANGAQAASFLTEIKRILEEVE